MQQWRQHCRSTDEGIAVSFATQQQAITLWASRKHMQQEPHLEIVPSHRMITFGWSVLRSSLTDN